LSFADAKSIPLEMVSPLISLHDASVAHREELPPAIHEITLGVHRGDWIAIAGDNGSGKTTLLAALGGVLPLRAGKMERATPLRVALLLQDPDDQLIASNVESELALSVPLDVDAVTLLTS
jgi:energy-coupling factor transporter ATP-binding protein EcfA2